jgi:pentatricopeptide repeat protein
MSRSTNGFAVLLTFLAFEVMKIMEERGFSPSRHLFHILFDYYCKKSDVEPVLGIIDMMKKHEIEMTTEFFGSFTCM